MKLIGSILCSLIFTQTLLAKNAKLSIKEALPYLSTIEPYALHVGSGPSKIYVFVDPLCPHSRNFIDLIVHSKKMQHKYSYSIFLYHLKKFDSTSVINYIYNCNKKMQCLKEVMLEHKLKRDVHHIAPVVKPIAVAAAKLGVDKRPYLFIQKVKRGE